MENLTTPQKIFLAILGIIVIIILAVYVFTKENSTTYSMENINSIEENKITEETNNIIIHIAGEVKEEGVVELPSEARIADAINAAGGITEQADLKEINLALILRDGQKIYIPNSEEIASGYSEQISGETVNKLTEYREVGKININNATQTELETLSGIGPSTALKIINYRNENGDFRDIEDLKNVPGIGEAKFNNIKDSVCIN